MDLKNNLKNALRTLLLLYSGAYTFQRAVLLGLSAEEAGRMDLLTCELSESAPAKGPVIHYRQAARAHLNHRLLHHITNSRTH